jgi:signal transduction histidine kinase/DNA-binding response OmpR family regulator
MSRRPSLLFIALLGCGAIGVAQQPPLPPTDPPVSAANAPLVRHPEAGGLLIRHYPPEAYDGGAQNWIVFQDARGVIYVGSTNALLEFDGVTWRRIQTPSRTTIRSMAVDATGRIWVGAVGDLGYIDRDEKGESRFVSIADQLPPDVRLFEDVWRLFAGRDGVYFQTQIGLFRWADGTMKVWKPTGRIFHRAQYANDTLYIGQAGGVLMALQNDELVPVPGAESLGDEPYPIILPYDEQRLLMGTRARGVFLYDGRTMTPFPTDADTLIKANNLYRGFVLPNEAIALTTTAAGMVILDRQGRLLEQIDQQDGLLSPSVYYVMPDREGGLWLALAVGLARVEAQSPFTLFGPDDGLLAGASDLARHNGTLYIAHGQGVQYLRPHPGRPPELVRVTGVANQCWAFFEFTDPDGRVPPQLLLTASDGLYLIEDGTARAVVESLNRSFGTFVLHQSAVNPYRLWVGLADGMASMLWSEGRWINEGRVAGVNDQVRSLIQDEDGALWAGTQTGGLVILRSADAPRGAPRPVAPTIQRYGAEQGLAPGGAGVVKIAGKPYVGVLGKTVVLDPASGAFVEDKTFEVVERNPDTGFINVFEGLDGRVYVSSGREAAVMTRQNDGTYVIDRQMFSRFAADGTGALYAEKDGVLWFGTAGRLARLDTSRFERSSPSFSALIRRVTLNQSETVSTLAAGDHPPELPAGSRTLRFEFAAPSFLNERATQYQSRLDGIDRDWSAWSTESRRDYTNLSFGDYRFHVRARNELGNISEEATFAFHILPPWYRTWWAYALYLLGFIGLVTLAAQTQRRRVVTKERQRAEVAQARLRAESAEAVAEAERERNESIEQLSAMGREITASLDFDTIFGRLYERVNQLADADVFGVGLYHPEREEIEYRLAIEQGKRYAPYSRSMQDTNQFAVWCITNRQPVFINDVREEHAKFIPSYEETPRPLEDGSLSRDAQSMIYLPLISKDRVLGVVTIQSFERGAYTERHLNMMQGLAAFTAIALDNAAAYRQLNEQEHEIRRLFDEAERARAAAEEADAAKSAFLSTVSHELRTPLTSVLGFAKIIKKRLEERIFPLVPADDRKVQQTMQQVHENLQVVVSEGERLTKLIDDVLDLAKIEAGKLEWHMGPITLQEVIDQATAATSALFDAKGLALVKQIAPDLPVVSGDRDRLVQVVINLISNAVKFTDAGSVTCRAERRGGEVVVSVSDTGLGIAPSDQPKVFERFKQVGDTLTDKPKGTGLGLPICREIVEHHGGRIWVESEPGRGSTFAFSLPTSDAVQPSLPLDLASVVRQLREQVAVSTPRTTERQPCILVVDDDANIRELLTQEFTEAGYAVATAADGRAAVQEVRRRRPDLVVLDVMMPEMNGFDVAAVLRNDPETADIPIVILSIVQDRERGFRLGVDRYLTKPIDTDLLFKEVGSLLEQRKSHKHVMVVDEDASTVKSLGDVLTARGYHVSEARGDDLFERAKTLRPDIILLNSHGPSPEAVQMLRFEKGLENVLFLVYR